MPLSLEQKAASAIGTAPFRGEIWEDAADVPMGKGYANDGQPFDINTAHYLKPVFEAIRNPNVREVWLKAGVQSLKTFTAEKSGSYFAVHDPGDMVFYDCDIKAARDHAKSRLGAFLHSIPGLAGQIAEIENPDDISTKEFYLPGMTLRIWPLNESSTQRITLRYVIIHDAFLSESSGMIGQAIARTTQHPHDKKIIIESQGSDEGDDFDRGFNGTNQGILHVKCPLCGEGQPDDFERKRDDGTHSGFQRGPDELILLPDGGYNAVEVMRNTHYECFFCRGKWLDVPETRYALDESSYYVSANPAANPAIVGFNWPNWINQRVRWGGDEVMMGYLNAKKADKEFGNKDPLKQWYQKRAAKTWSDKMLQKPVAIITGTRNVSGVIPNEATRVMGIDCQQGDIPQKTGKFWVDSWAIDRAGKVLTQLERGYANSWQEWFDVKKNLKIPNDNLGIDGGNYLDEILDAAGANFEVVERVDARTKKKFKARSVWKVLIGDGRRKSYNHGDNLFRSFSKPTYYQRRVQVAKGQFAVLHIPVFYWSNLSIKDHFYSLIRGGPNLPQLVILSHDQLSPETQLKEVGDLTYAKQIENQYRGPHLGQQKWIETSPNVHYADCGCECVALLDMGGYLGLPAAADEDGQSV